MLPNRLILLTAGLAGLGVAWYLPGWLKRFSPTMRAYLIGAVFAALAAWFVVLTGGDLQVSLGLMLLILTFMFLLYQPIVGLIVLIGLIYVRPQEIFPSMRVLKPVMFTGITAILVWMLRTALSRGRDRFIRHPTDLLILCFWASMIISVLGNAPHLFSYTIMSFLDKPIIFFLVLGTISSRKRLKLLIFFIIAYTTFLAASGIWEGITGVGPGNQTPIDGRIRLLGIFSDPNDLAQAFVICMPFVIWIVMESGYGLLLKTSGALLGCAMIYAVYLTGSRGGMLSLAAVLGLHLRRRTGTIVAVLVGVAFVAAMIAFGPSRLSEISGEDESAQGRLEAWRVGIRLFRMNPIYGIGFSRYTEFHHLVAHNSFIHVLAETGFLGTFFWIAMIYLGVRNVIDVLRANDEMGHVFLASLAGLLLSSFFLSRSYSVLLFLVLSMISAYRRILADDISLPEFRFRAFDGIMVVGIELAMIVGMYLLTRILY